MRCVCIASVAFDDQSVGTLPGWRIRENLPNAALYWDKITVPVFAKGAEPALDRDLEVLEAEGSAISWQHKQENSFTMQELFDFTNIVVEGLASRLKSPGDQWSILIPSGGSEDMSSYYNHLLSRLPQSKRSKHTLTLAFMDALPICPPDTPFQDILEFKRRRSDNLDNLHREIEYLSTSLSSAEDIEDAIRIGRERVAKALQDIDKVFSERWSSRVLTALRANTGSITAGALGGMTIGGAAGFSLPMMTLAGGAIVPAIEAVVNQIANGQALPDRASPYLYAIQSQRELRR